jgi:hypothetical protein
MVYTTSILRATGARPGEIYGVLAGVELYSTVL